MSVFAILDNKVYTMSEENAKKIRRVPTKLAPGLDAPFYPYGSWDESHDLSAHIVHSVLNVSSVSLTSNAENVQEVIDTVNENKLTELLRINPTVKMMVTYSVLDAFHHEIESKVSKVTVGTLNEMLVPMSLDYDDQMEYVIAQNITCRVVLAAAFRELGISKSTRSASRIIAIHNIVVSISTTDESVYSQFLSTAQSDIGWTPTSPTQAQVSEYDIPIFNLADTHPHVGLPALPHYIEVDDRSDKVYLDVDLTTSLFAYTLRDMEIEKAIILNQRKQMQYKVVTATDSHCEVDTPIIEHIEYGSSVELNVTADPSFRVSRVSIQSTFHVDEVTEIPEGDGSDYSFTSPGNPEVLIECAADRASAKITITGIGESYTVGVYTTAVPAIPSEEDTPSTTPSDTKDEPSEETPVEPGDSSESEPSDTGTPNGGNSDVPKDDTASTDTPGSDASVTP